MTRDQDITRIVRAWLQPDAPESSERVLAVVLGRLDTTPQRKRLRQVQDHRSWYLRLAAVAAMLAAGGGLALFMGSSPEPTPTPWQPPAGLVTEPVELGVERVTSDGYRDLSWARGLLGYYGSEGEFVVGLDAGIWNVGPFSSRSADCEDQPCALYRIGDPSTHDRAPGARWLAGGGYGYEPAMFEVAPDGTVWAGVETSTGPILYSFDGEAWTSRWTPPAGTQLTGLAIGSDGTVWATWQEETPFVDGQPRPAPYRAGIVRLRGEADVQEHSFDADVEFGSGPTPLASSPDGRFVLFRMGNEIMRLGGPADGVVTEPFAVLGPLPECPEPAVDCEATPPRFKVGDDGTVAYETEGLDHENYLAVWRGPNGNEDISGGGGAWDLVPNSCPQAHLAAVGPDGAVWLVPNSDAGRGCGLIRWQASDGARVYLRNYAIASLDIAPDGSAWVHAIRPDEPDKGGSPQVDVLIVRPDQAGDVK